MASDQVGGTGHHTTWNQTSASPGSDVGDPRHQAMPVLTEEERQAMRDCDRDSFFQRAAPLSFGCMLGAHMLVKSGRWSPNPKYGSLPKVIAMGGIGYFLGKLSYLPVCQRRILEKLPNSNLAAAIRRSKGLPEPETSNVPLEDETVSAPSSTRLKEYSAPVGLDDRFRPTMDRDVKEPEMEPKDKSSVGYEELRRRNRQEYESQISRTPPKAPAAPSIKDNSSMPQQPWSDTKSDDSRSSGETLTPPSSQVPSTKKRTNIWGDPIEE